MPNVWLALGRGPGCAVLDLERGGLERGGLERGGLERGGLDLGDQLRDDLDQLRDSLATCLLIDKQTTNKQDADPRGLDLDEPRRVAQLVEVRRQQNLRFFDESLNFYRCFPSLAPGK